MCLFRVCAPGYYERTFRNKLSRLEQSRPRADPWSISYITRLYYLPYTKTMIKTFATVNTLLKKKKETKLQIEANIKELRNTLLSYFLDLKAPDTKKEAYYIALMFDEILEHVNKNCTCTKEQRCDIGKFWEADIDIEDYLKEVELSARHIAQAEVLIKDAFRVRS